MVIQHSQVSTTRRFKLLSNELFVYCPPQSSDQDLYGRTPLISTKDVGTASHNVECEIVGVQIALEAIDEYVKSLGRNGNLNAFILTDCIAAIDIACNQTNPEKRIQNFREIWKHLEKLEK